MKNKVVLSSLFFICIASSFIFFYSKNDSSVDFMDTSWKEVRNKGSLIIGLDDTFAPMGFRDRDGDIIGFDVDLAREVGRRLNLKVIFQPCVWSSVFLELKGKNIDAIWNGVSISPSRKKQTLFSDPYLTNRMVVVINEKSRNEIKRLSDLNGKKIAVQSGSPAYDYVKNYKEKNFNPESLKELVQYPDNSTALLDLAYGGVDAVVVDEIVADYYIAKKKVSLLKIKDTLTKEEYGIAFRKKDYSLRNKIQETLDEMRRDGTAKRISQKWFGRDVF